LKTSPYLGHISPGLPQFQLPPFEIYNPQDNRTHTFTEILKEEASALVVVPLLGIIGHCTIAKVVAGPERVDAAQEILVLGISNAIACFFSSMPIGGSFSRTTVNLQSGVKTPLCGLITGSLVILALEFLTPYFLYIPKASIAAVICVSCLFMVNPYIMLPLWRSKSEYRQTGFVRESFDDGKL
jgi:sodium-independent sulfate anion transporter 11